MSELKLLHKTSRTQGTIIKAKKISETVSIMPDNKTYLVQGSKKKNEFGKDYTPYYEVEQIDEKWVCNDIDKNDICQGWKFCTGDNKDCKHVLAVLIHLGYEIQIIT